MLFPKQTDPAQAHTKQRDREQRNAKDDAKGNRDNLEVVDLRQVLQPASLRIAPAFRKVNRTGRSVAKIF
jgi:hypothetical protein